MRRLLVVACIVAFVLLGLTGRPVYAFGETYIVQPGDTLFTIAARYGLNVGDLAAANGLNSSYGLYPGQQLTIPDSTPFFEPPPFAGRTYPAIEPGFVGNSSWFDPSIYPGQQPVMSGGPLNPYGDSLLTRPALPVPPIWDTQGYTPAQPWRSRLAPPPIFYDSPPPLPFSNWPARSNPANERWIDVDLSRQTLTAYEGQRPIFYSRVSSGLPQYPTIVGTFAIYVKYESADMSGGAGDDEYFLPSVPYVMYFHGNYGLHGTYWHHNFGRPMSHGCVNLPTPAAEWLFNWASVGTRVVTHY